MSNNGYYRQRVLGVDFFRGTTDEAVEASLEGGLVLAPSGPGLAELDRQPHYAKALSSGDVILVDSGLLALLWRLKTGEKLTRISGLRYLISLLDQPILKNPDTQFWVMPSVVGSQANRAYMSSRGVDLPESSCYVAPYYPNCSPIEDPVLLKKIEGRHPQIVMINLAGGKQEILGAWLKANLSYRPTMVCTGAAIAFLTGQQTRIGTFVDRIYMGWLQRILSSPMVYTKRYWAAMRLIPLALKYKESKPS